MKKNIYSLLIVAVILTTAISFTGTAYAVSYDQLAAYWAPEVYQDVNATYSYQADFITKFDYDGNWIGKDNWQNLYSYALPAYSYYWVQETDTHYFIGYCFFHCRDDGPTSLDAHENDMEGIILAVRKDGSTYGQLQLMETLAHDQWYQYTNDSGITTGLDNVDGGILMNGSHPKIFIQSNGQSPWGGHGIHNYDGSGAPGGDGIVYYYGGVAEIPGDATGDYTHRYSYALKSIDEFWSRRYDIGDSSTFASWGVLRGDDYQANSAKLPWGWDDSDDGATFIGEMFSDPAFFMDTHLNGLGSFSHNYIYNKYWTYKFDCTSITSLSNRDPFGGKSDIYPKFLVNGEKFSDDRLWKKNDAPTGTRYYVNWGYNDAADGMQYSTAFHSKYVAMPHNLPVSISIMDSDGTSGDDDMGSLSATLSAGQTVTWTEANTSNANARVTASITANTDY